MPTEPIAPAEDESPRHPGVLILRVPSATDPSKEDIQIIPINGMDSLAVPMLLKIAIRVHAESFGV